MADEVRAQLEGGVLSLTIDRPGQRNALNGAVISALLEHFRAAAGDTAVRVVTLTGAGDRVFCAGADLRLASPDEGAQSGFDSAAYRDLLLQIVHCPVPTVALARGHVMAGGLGLFLACDFALACDDTHFSTPEVNVGMFPMMVLALLYRHVGRKAATEMLFLGDRISAAEAMHLGILNRVYRRDEFEAGAREFIQKLAEKSSKILRLGKGAILHVEERSLRADIEYLETELAKVMSTEDSREGMRAFLEKRKPVWRDR